ALGECRADSSRGEHRLPLLDPFPSLSGPFPSPAGLPPRRSARPPLFPALQVAGEARRHLRIAVRTSPSPLWPRLVAPPHAAAARRRRARACDAVAVPTPRSRPASP